MLYLDAPAICITPFTAVVAPFFDIMSSSCNSRKKAKKALPGFYVIANILDNTFYAMMKKPLPPLSAIFVRRARG